MTVVDVLLASIRPPWFAQAACAGPVDDVAARVAGFFPDAHHRGSDAKQVCAGCPVRAECLAYAVAHPELRGIWGGMSEAQRRRMRTTREPAA